MGNGTDARPHTEETVLVLLHLSILRRRDDIAECEILSTTRLPISEAQELHAQLEAKWLGEDVESTACAVCGRLVARRWLLGHLIAEHTLGPGAAVGG